MLYVHYPNLLHYLHCVQVRHSGIMERASRGEYGMSVAKDYGIFPRALLQIFARYKSLLSSSGKENTF